MYCQSCGKEVGDHAEFCRACGESLPNSMDTSHRAFTADETHQWNPKLPITSVFASIIFLWSAVEYANIGSLLIFGLPGVLIIPRIRRYIAQWVRDEFNKDLTNTGVIVVVGGILALLLVMAIMSVIGSTANDPTIGGPPTRQLTVGLLTIALMFGFAVAIVIGVRVNRKLQA